MKIIQTNAVSLNGIIARLDGQEDWLPDEGWDEFIADAQQCGNFIMGRETYELVTNLYPNYNFDNVCVEYKIIVTTRDDFVPPDGYIVVRSPEEAVGFLRGKGSQTGLLIGGGNLNSSFYARGLVDETWITVNPILLGQGRPVIAHCDIEKQLELIDIVRLSKGRVQLKYRVLEHS